MTPEDKRRLKDAFKKWAENMPEPDKPSIGFIGEKLLSPRQAAQEVENETAIGKDFLYILEHGVAVEGLDKVVERLTRKGP